MRPPGLVASDAFVQHPVPRRPHCAGAIAKYSIHFAVVPSTSHHIHYNVASTAEREPCRVCVWLRGLHLVSCLVSPDSPACLSGTFRRLQMLCRHSIHTCPEEESRLDGRAPFVQALKCPGPFRMRMGASRPLDVGVFRHAILAPLEYVDRYVDRYEGEHLSAPFLSSSRAAASCCITLQSWRNQGSRPEGPAAGRSACVA